MQLDIKDIAGAIVIIIGGIIAAWRQKAKPAEAENPAITPPPPPIEPLKPGDDPWQKTNVLIDALNDERRERAEDRRRFHEVYSGLAVELNTERIERQKLDNELGKERAERQALDARLTATQGALTAALTDNGQLIRKVDQLTADNSALRKVNTDLLTINAQLRTTIAQKDEQIDQLMQSLAEARDELELSTELLKQKVDHSETGGIE